MTNTAPEKMKIKENFFTMGTSAFHSNWASMSAASKCEAQRDFFNLQGLVLTVGIRRKGRLERR